MTNERNILAIGRIERALSKLEQYRPPATQAGDSDLQIRHERLKTEAQRALSDIDRLLAKEAN
jgi:hypothetical protein